VIPNAPELAGGDRERYDAQVAAALGAVEVRPPGAFLWFGRRVAVPAAAVRAATDAALARELLVDAIGQRLHAGFFGAAQPRPRRGAAATPPDDGGAFARALSQANCGRGTWQSGWRVTAVDGDTVAVVRPDGLRLLAPADDCRIADTNADAGPAGAGACAAVRVAKERTGLRPGVYIACGDAAPAPAAGDGPVRLYWNIAAGGAVTLVARVTYALNRAGLPFSLELLDNPARYGRRPAADLVVAKTDAAPAIKLLRPLPRALAAHLADGAPAFAKPLARGLALGEDPTDGRRFGEHRCRLLADAIVAAREQGLHSTQRRLDVVRERFAAAGIRLDAPYLKPGSDDAYERS
jgi:hypothetical protein